MSFLHDGIDDEDITDLLYQALPCYINGKFASLKDEDEPYVESVEYRDALHIKMEMSGVGKEDVRVTIDKDVMSIHGDQKGDDGNKKKSYSLRTTFKPIRVYSVQDIKVVIKNSMLKVVVPRDENNRKRTWMCSRFKSIDF